MSRRGRERATPGLASFPFLRPFVRAPPPLRTGEKRGLVVLTAAAAVVVVGIVGGGRASEETRRRRDHHPVVQASARAARSRRKPEVRVERGWPVSVFSGAAAARPLLDTRPVKTSTGSSVHYARLPPDRGVSFLSTGYDFRIGDR